MLYQAELYQVEIFRLIFLFLLLYAIILSYLERETDQAPGLEDRTNYV